MPIEFKHVNFTYDTIEEPLFHDVQLSLDTKWKLGLIGRNGRGKTTLLKLLMKELSYTGEIFSDEPFVYFPFNIEDHSVLTIYAIEAVITFEQWRLERECQLLGLDKSVLWQPFDELSGGEQTKVMLAALFCNETHFPLLDEPTNHLDMKAREIVACYLKKKNGFIVISHDRNFIDEVVDHILVIEKSKLVLYKGDFSTYEMQKKLQDEYELNRNRMLKNEIERLHKTAREKADWASEREKPSGNDPFGNAIAKRMNKRAKAIENRIHEKIDEKTKLLKNFEQISDLTINCESTHRNPVLRVNNFTLSYSDDKPLFEPLTFDIYQHEQVAIVGPNGSGKTSILNFLKGTFRGNIHGEIVVPKGLTKSFLRQVHDDNRGNLKDFAMEKSIDYTLFLNNLRILGFERDVFLTNIENMSNGQQKKVELAASLGCIAEFYIWDEPLNYLDVFNQQQMKTMINKYKPTLLFVEHDTAFVKAVATKSIELKSVK